MKPVFSIVIPVLNSRSTLELVLRCLEAQSFPRADFECVIVDDGSTDGTQELLNHYRGRLPLNILTHRARAGRAQSREVGWRQSRGEIVVFLNGDMLFPPNWLEAYHTAFQQKEAEVISGGHYHLNLETKKESALQLASLAHTEPEELLARNVAEQFRRLQEYAAPGQYPHPVSEELERPLPALCDTYPQSLVAAYSFMASNAAVRRSLLEKSSGFNPCWRRFDDLELGIRLWETGARFAFAREAAACHLREAARAFEWFTLNELVSLFCRHPYHLVLLMHFWGYHHSPGNPPHRHPIFDSLLTLAAEGASPNAPDGSELFASIYKQPLPADCRYGRDKLIEYFAKLPCWSTSLIAAELDWAVERGLFTQRKDEQYYFDINHTDNWLRDNTTILQRWLTTYVFGDQKTQFLKTQQPSDLLSVRCRGT
jgi:glycosyltransferase involved in cell wall biosynthesis